MPDVNIGEMLSRRARLQPQSELMLEVTTGRRSTYGEMESASNRLAHALTGLGLAKGDRVGVLMPNSFGYLQTFFALAKLGVVAVPLNSRLTASELEYIGSNAGIKALVYAQPFDEVAAELRGMLDCVEHWIRHGEGEVPGALDFAGLTATGADEPVEVTAGDDDVLYLMYTSGTTGFPKGTVHSHVGAFWAILTIEATGDFRHGDTYFNAMPLFHVGALVPAMIAVYAGMRIIMEAAFDPVRAWQLIAQEKANIALLVPAMLLAMRQTHDPSLDLSSLRWFLSGASPVPVSVIQAYGELGIRVEQVFGMTETGGPACMLVGEEAVEHMGSTGKGTMHTCIKVVGPQGEECAPGEPGEVLIKGPHCMLEYWNNPEATAETLVDGWVHSGDVGTMDEHGYVTIVDRIKDMVISGGENIYPAELENVLVGMDGIVEAAIIGAPSEQWGETPLAVVVSKDPDLTEGAVIEHCLGKLARYKRIAGVRFVEQLPRNPSGKVVKHRLREQFADVRFP